MIALLAAEALAAEIRQEVAVGAGFALHTGPEAAVGGFGPSVTWRLHLGEYVAPHVTLAPRLFLPLTLEIAAGVIGTVPVKTWRPGLGVEVASFVGGAVRRATEAEPEAFARGPVWDVRGVLRPLAFVRDDWTLSVWSVSLGRGLDAPATTWAVSIEFVSIGWLF